MDFMDFGMFWGEKVSQPVAADYTGVVALKKPCNLGTSIPMTEPGSLQAWRLAAWMVILQPAIDSKWICVDFMDLGVFWG